jgi:hypothetical protein
MPVDSPAMEPPMIATLGNRGFCIARSDDA